MSCEPQYAPIHAFAAEQGPQRLGLMAGHTWHTDPKRLGMVAARYKFVAKQLKTHKHVLEIGCADGFGSQIVRQHVTEVTAIDMDQRFIEDAKQKSDPQWPVNFIVHDMLQGPLPWSQWNENKAVGVASFSAAYCLDVLEHIRPEDENKFMANVCQTLTIYEGVFIVGMPSLESQAYASKQSREGHVNCKTQADLEALMLKWFNRIFSFSMNDEMLHCGFGPMSHYLLVIGVGKR